MGIVGQPFHGIPSQTHEYIEWYLANLIPFLNMQGPQVTVDIGVSNTSVETHQMKPQQCAQRRRTPMHPNTLNSRIVFNEDMNSTRYSFAFFVSQ